MTYSSLSVRVGVQGDPSLLVIKRVFGWLARKAILYIIIVLAIVASAFVVPWIKAEWTGPSVHIDRAKKLEAVRQDLQIARSDASRRLSVSAGAAKTKSIAEIDQALSVATQIRASSILQRRSTVAQAASLATVDTNAILADRRRELEIQLRDREIAGLRAARDRLIKRNLLGSLVADLKNKISQANQLEATSRRARAVCGGATDRLSQFESRWLVRITWQQYQREQHANLKRQKDARCAEADRRSKIAQSAKAAALAIEKRRIAAARAYQQSRSWIGGPIESVTGEIDRRIEAERTTATGSLRQKLGLWAERLHLKVVLKKAAFSLLAILLSPYLIRLFCYFVLAPAAMRRPAIRLRVPGDSAVNVPLSKRSTTSVAVRLTAGEELLVRQDYLQTTSHSGAKGTQWFMDWRHPVTSIVTGLTFLTRIRGDSSVTTVSAVQDPFAEVTILTLPEGGACVLQPHAIAAFVQPSCQRLRVTGHWRLLSLNAWLTMQLRYLVFHGPARIIIKGGRGVRVEQAALGRIFGQRQLVGFSADLAYSVTRAETFWPYFFGREQLLKDRVEAGEGVLIVEEAPMAGRSAGDVRRGIEGIIDAGMKVFGM